MLFQWWSTGFDAGPTIKQHRVNASCCWAGSSSPGARYRQSVPQGGNLPTVMTVGLPPADNPTGRPIAYRPHIGFLKL